MSQVITRERNVYGNDLIYPLTHQDDIKALTGCKTLTRQHIAALRSLGVTVSDWQGAA